MGTALKREKNKFNHHLHIVPGLRMLGANIHSFVYCNSVVFNDAQARGYILKYSSPHNSALFIRKVLLEIKTTA